MSGWGGRLLITPYTLNPKPETLNPKPYATHPTLYTLNPTPSTLNPKPKTQNLNLKPQHQVGRGARQPQPAAPENLVRTCCLSVPAYIVGLLYMFF